MRPCRAEDKVELVDDAVAGRPVGQPEPWVELGAELLIDEEHIKCWIETVPPGERRPAHTHRHPWVTVVLNGASCESFGEDGRLIRARTLETGQVFHNSGAELPMRHYVHNVSDRTLTMVAIEVRGR